MANANEGETIAVAADESNRSISGETMLAFKLVADPVVSVLMAAASFEDLETGRAWFSTASAALKNETPLALLGTQQGRSTVMNELCLIEHGMF